MERVDGEVAEESKHTVSIVAKVEVARPLELVYEVEAVCVVGVLIRLYEPAVQEGYVRCSDPQRAAEMVVALQSLTYACQCVPPHRGVAPDHGCLRAGSDFLYDPSAFELFGLSVFGWLSGGTSGRMVVKTYPCAVS